MIGNLHKLKVEKGNPSPWAKEVESVFREAVKDITSPTMRLIIEVPNSRKLEAWKYLNYIKKNIPEVSISHVLYSKATEEDEMLKYDSDGS